MTTYDAAIIGGGPIGLATAHELVAHGRSVVLIDRGGADGGVGVGSAGFIVPSLVMPLAAPGALTEFIRSMIRGRDSISIRPSVSPAWWRWAVQFAQSCRLADDVRLDAALAMHRLAQSSIALLSDWIERYDIRCGWQRSGVLDVYADATRLEHAATLAERLGSVGVASSVLSAAEARRLEPTLTDRVSGGVLFRGDGSLHPGAFLGSMRDVVTSLGVDVRDDVSAFGWDDPTSGPITISTSGGPIRADRLVVAAGVDASAFQQMLGVRVPVIAARGLSITFPVSRGPRIPLLLGERHIAVAPLGDEVRISGGFEIGRNDLHVSSRQVRRLTTATRERVDVEIDTVGVVPWAGRRPVSADGLPIIGYSPASARVVLATGHQMVGLSFAPGTASVVASLVRGDDPGMDLRVFDPRRFGLRRSRRRV